MMMMGDEGVVELRVAVWLGIRMSKSMVELKVVPGSQLSPGRPVWMDIMCMSRRGMVQCSDMGLVSSWRLLVFVLVGRAQMR